MRELPASIASLKVVELRAACTERGLPSSGLKAELVKRLKAFRAEQEEGNAEEENGEEAIEDHAPVSDSVDLSAPATAGEDGKELEEGSAQGLQTAESAAKNDDGEAEAPASSADDAGTSAIEGAEASSASTSDAVQRAVEEEQAAEPEVEQANANEEAPVESHEPVNGMQIAEHDGQPATEAAVEPTSTEQPPEQDEAEEDMEKLNARRSDHAAAEHKQSDVPPSAEQEGEESISAQFNEPEPAVKVMAEQPETETPEQPETETSAVVPSIEPAVEGSEEVEGAVTMEVDAVDEGEKRKAEELGDAEEGDDGGARKRMKLDDGAEEEPQQVEVTKDVAVKSEGKGENGEEVQKRKEHPRQHEDEEEGEVHEEKKPLGKAEKGTELFVGGIGYNISEDELRKVFAAHGEIVDLRVIRDRMGQPKGFGFVRYAKRDAADKAIAALDRVDVHGRRLQVSRSQHTDHVYISNLPEGWGESEVRAFLEKKALFGVEEIEVVMDEDGKSKGMICVQFDNHQNALQCYRAANSERLEAEGRSLRVDWTAPGEGRRRDGGEEVIVRTCFVGNLPPSTTEEELQTLLSVHGEVERVTLGKDTARRNDAFAFVRFKDRDIAHKAYDACKTDKPELRGSQLEVEMAKAPTSRTRGRSRSRDRSHDRRSRNTSYDRRDRDYGRDRGGSGYRDRDRDGGRYGRERDRSRERGGGYGRDREREWGGGGGGGGGGRFERRSRGYERGGYDDDRGGGYRERDRGGYPRDNRGEFMAGRTYEPQSYQAEPPLRGGPTTDSYGSYRDRSRSPRYPSARQPLPTAQATPAPAAPRYYSGPPVVSGAPYQPARPLAPITHPSPHYNPAPVTQPSSYAAPLPAVHGYAATPTAAPYSQHLQPSGAPSSSGYVAGGIGAGMSAGALSPPVAGGGMRGQGSYGEFGNLPPYGR